jgi:LEA14-like dessication related protein
MFLKKKYFFMVFSPLLMLSCTNPKSLDFTGFENFQVQPISFTNSKISFGIGIFNPNAFDIRVNHLRADVELAGAHLGNYEMDSLVTLPGNQSFILPVELVVKNGTLISNMLGVLAGDSIAYSLAGKVKAGRKIGMTEIPFTYSGHLSQKDFNTKW